MSGSWPVLDTLLDTLRAAPSRTGSIIVTIYGDAILPRGGALALSDLLAIMRRIGATDGVVRTAVSRLARDGLLQGQRIGRHSDYALSAQGETEFRAAVPRIYGPLCPNWDGRLRLVFSDSTTDRAGLEAVGFVPLSPGVLVFQANPPPGTPFLFATGDTAVTIALAARAWPLDTLKVLYREFTSAFAPLLQAEPPTPLDALVARIVLIHAWRRIALRDPHLPAELLPPAWAGHRARELCIACYAGLAGPSEAWLDAAGTGSGPLPAGPDPMLRFSAGDKPRSAPASSP